MKKIHLFVITFLTLFSVQAIGQTTVANELIIKNNLKNNSATRVMVQDSITKKTGFVLKSTLATDLTPINEKIDSILTATNIKIDSISTAANVRIDSAIVAGANVNADWNAITGDAEILNKPDLSLKENVANKQNSFLPVDSTGEKYPTLDLLNEVNDRLIIVENFTPPPTTGLTGQAYAVWSGIGLKYFGTWPGYYIEGVFKPAGDDEIILEPTTSMTAGQKRYDLIILDANGLNKITGVPDENPVLPTIDPDTQIVITNILLNAGDEVPSDQTSNREQIFDENTEWTVSKLGACTINANYAVNPYKGTKSLLVNAFGSGNEAVKFTASSTKDLLTYTHVCFRIKLLNFTNKDELKLRFEDNLGFVSSEVVVKKGLYNFTDYSSAYQLVVIPLSDFTIYRTDFTIFSIYKNSGNDRDFQLDDVFLAKAGASTVDKQKAITSIVTNEGVANATQKDDTFIFNSPDSSVGITASDKTINFTVLNDVSLQTIVDQNSIATKDSGRNQAYILKGTGDTNETFFQIQNLADTYKHSFGLNTTNGYLESYDISLNRRGKFSVYNGRAAMEYYDGATNKALEFRFNNPIANTVILGPNKGSDGVYTLATLDDIPSVTTPNLQQVVDVSGLVSYSGSGSKTWYTMTGSGSMIRVDNSSSGRGIYVNNTGVGFGGNYTNSSSGKALEVTNSGIGGIGINISNTNTGHGLYVSNSNATGKAAYFTTTSTGTALEVNGGPSSTSDIVKFSNNGTRTGGITKEGNIDTNGTLKLSSYGSGTNTGTPTYSLAVDSDGNVIEKSIPVIDSGSYSPTVEQLTNIASYIFNNATYTRIGDIVTVSFGFFLTPTTADSDFNIRITLPVDRATSTTLNIGSGSGRSSLTDIAAISAQSNNFNKVLLGGRFTTTNEHFCEVKFQYNIND